MKRLLLLALCALFALNAEARTLYVDWRQPNNGRSGRSLKKAKKTIQAAVNVAKAGDTILVYPGTYGSIKTNNRKIAVKSVKGSDRTTVKKGYAYGANWCLNLGKWRGKSFKGGKATTVKGFLCKGNGFANYKGCGGAIGGTVKHCTFESFQGSLYWLGVGNAQYKNADSSNPKKFKPLFFKSTLADCILLDCYQNTEVHDFMNRCSVQRTRIEMCGGVIQNSTLCNSLLYGGKKYLVTSGGGDHEYGPLLRQSKAYNCTFVGYGQGRFLSPFWKSKAWNSAFWNIPPNTFKQRKSRGNSFSRCYEGGPDPGFVSVENFWVLGESDYRRFQSTGRYEDVWVDTSHYEQTWVPGYYEEQWIEDGYWEDSYWVDTSYWDDDLQDWVEDGYMESGDWVDTSHYGEVWVDGYYEDEWVEDGYWDSEWTEDPCDVGPDFRLKSGSRCIDKGKLTKAQRKLVGTKDLAGKKRVKGKAVDIGCYEY